METSHTSIVRLATVLAPLAMLALCGGCYDGEILVQEARATAMSPRLAEVDLGKYLTTLPRDPGSDRFTEMEVHLFATVSRSRASKVERLLKAEQYRLRHGLLATLRSASPEELAEPSLGKLRKRVEGVVNFLLGDPVKSVGFYSVTMRPR